MHEIGRGHQVAFTAGVWTINRHAGQQAQFIVNGNDIFLIQFLFLERILAATKLRVAGSLKEVKLPVENSINMAGLS